MISRERAIHCLLQCIGEDNAIEVLDKNLSGFHLVDIEENNEIQVIVLDKLPTLSNVQQVLSTNTQHNIYTMVVVNRALLPEGDAVDLNDYPLFAMIHAVTYGRIYAYYEDEGGFDICSVHYEPTGQHSNQRMAMVEVDVETGFSFLTSKTNSRYAKGAFRIANFSEGPFWKDYATPRYSRHSRSPFGDFFQQPDPAMADVMREFFDQSAREAYGGIPWSPRPEQQQPPPGARQRVYEPPKPQAPLQLRPAYLVLDIDYGCTLAEAKDAYRKLAREYHPDKHPGEEALYTAKMQELNNAWEKVRKSLS